MSPLRSARRLSSVTSQLLYRQPGALSGLCCSSIPLTDSTALPAFTRHVGQFTGPQTVQHLPPTVCLCQAALCESAVGLKQSQGLRMSLNPQGFAASSITTYRQISSNSFGPDSGPPASSRSPSAGADTSSSDSDSEQAESDGLESSDAQDDSQPFNQPAVVETEKDELLQKIQSASKKHQRSGTCQALGELQLTCMIPFTVLVSLHL